MNASESTARKGGPERAAGLVLVVALHLAALWLLLQHRLLPTPPAAMTLFVNFIAPPVPEKHIEPERPAPKPKPVEKPQPRQIVAETPRVEPTDRVAPPQPAAEPVPAAPPPGEPPAMPLPAVPLVMTTELAVACPERSAPAYPPRSRRDGEEGTVVLRVELSEHGAVETARIQSSSGFARLDEAALTAIRGWRCTPARRGGQPVRATALQPFKFVLREG